MAYAWVWITSTPEVQRDALRKVWNTPKDYLATSYSLLNI